ncbi:MAG: DUF6851 domain-containing protein [Xenococcaceae cyanobacterium]
MKTNTVLVTIENLSPQDGTYLTPTWVGFHDGSFDIYNPGESLALFPGTESLVEDGNAEPLSAQFNTTNADSIQGIIANDNEPIAPGESASLVLELDGNDRYFSFASMVIPSNDAFIANEDPLAYPIFDEQGNLIKTEFIVQGFNVLDGGTEVNDEIPANTAFLGQETPNTGNNENGVVTQHPGFQPAGNGGILDDSQFTNADFTADDYQVARITVEPFIPELNVDPDTQLVTVDDPSPSISVLWDQAVQQAVINTEVGPTIASRAYSMVHTAIFDAWAAYDPTAIATQLGDDLQRPEEEITEANKEEAMSFAAYRVSIDLFPDQAEIFNELMAELGFDPNNTTTDTTTAAGVGNVSAEALLEFRREDGSNQNGDDPNGTLGVPYSDNSGYEPVNLPGETIDLERWTPELVPIDAEPGEEDKIQEFLTPQWGDVTPFALESGEEFRPEEPEPFLLVEGEVDLEAQTITLEETGEVLSITRDLIGDVINPEFIEQAEEIVEVSANLTDEQKLVAEFWEDGGGTSFPPGTWMTFGEFVSARDNNSLDEDAQLFFALGNAVFDAGIATWESKTYYDYNRPVRTVRELGELGLIGEFNEELGGFAIEAWAGPGEGTQTILATDFITYQTPGSDSSPPFAEYTSGHSAFSAAGAEILQLFTGSDEFGGSVTFEHGESRFEHGVTPHETVTLEWETFTEAADEAGVSRIYGGIHFEDGDLNGRQFGQEVGQAVWEEAQFFIQGGEPEPEPANQPIFGTLEDDIFDAADASDNFNGKDNLLFAGAGNDLVDASAGSGGNRIYGQGGNDELLAGVNDRVLGGEGDDLLDASLGRGGNHLNGQEGKDTFLVGGGDRYSGGEGDDTFFVIERGNNVLTGGEGADAFWIATGQLVTEVNIITDFELDEDVIGVAGLGISSAEELTFIQVEDDTTISFSDFDLAVLQNTQASNLPTNATFAFA